MKHCYDDNCANPAQHRLLRQDMCTAHYIEALEHSAHVRTVRTRMSAAEALDWMPASMWEALRAAAARARRREENAGTTTTAAASRRAFGRR
jgi:hypothetical protein